MADPRGAGGATRDAIDYRAGRQPFGEYALSLLEQRVDMRPRTVETYRSELRHAVPMPGLDGRSFCSQDEVSRLI